MRAYRILALSALCLAAFHSAGVYAQSFPTKPVRLIVGYSAGGSSDLIARLLADKVSRSLNQPVIVENKAGAAGQVASQYVAHIAPDGYTLLVTNTAPASVAPALYEKVGYAPKDFAAVTLTTVSPMVVTSLAHGKYNTLRDLIAAARSKPDSLNFASTGAGSLGHVANEIILKSAGLKVGHIPYKSGGEVMTAMLADDVDYTIGAYTDAMGMLKAGKLVALAVTTSKRVPTLPSVPTLTESGIPRAEIEYWTGIVAPKGTPEPVIAKLNKAVGDALENPEVIGRMKDMGLQPKHTTAAEFQSLIDADYKRWAQLASVINIKP